MQVELLDRRRWRTRIEQANAIFDYLEWHNRRRRHSSIGMLSPIEYERVSTVVRDPSIRLQGIRGRPTRFPLHYVQQQRLRP